VRPQTPSGRIVASLASVTHTPQILQPYVCTSLSLMLSGIVRARPMGLPQLGHMSLKVGRSLLIVASVTEAKFPRIDHQFRG
jgi:ribosomal protein L34E